MSAVTIVGHEVLKKTKEEPVRMRTYDVYFSWECSKCNKESPPMFVTQRQAALAGEKHRKSLKHRFKRG